MMAGFLPKYFNSLSSDTARRRYMDELKLVDGTDPYEVLKNEWKDNIDLWPAITHVHVCMYLILTPSPYSDKDMLNYKSLGSYQSFVKGWVRQVLVIVVGEKRMHHDWQGWYSAIVNVYILSYLLLICVEF